MSNTVGEGMNLDNFAYLNYCENIFNSGSSKSRDVLIKKLNGIINTKLTEKQRRSVKLYYFDGLNLKQTGKILGVGESEVCRILSRARKRIKNNLHPR